MTDTPKTNAAAFRVDAGAPEVESSRMEEVVTADFARAQERALARAAFPKDRNDPATWVLHLLAHGEISVGKAAEWLREYIRDNKHGPLPVVESLP